MKNKILSLLPLVVLTITSCTKEEGQPLVAPTFEPTEGLSFTAYSGPRVASGNIPNTLTDYHIQKVAEAGFNKMIALYDGASGASANDTYELIKKRSEKAEKDAMMALDICERYGIKYYVRDWSFYGLPKLYRYGFNPNIVTDEQYETVIAKMFDENNPYIHHNAYIGNFCCDEPTYEELDRVAVQVQLYQKYLAKQGATGEALVNLYPDHVDSSGLSTEQFVTYRQYVEHYCDLFSPLLNYICFDFYPFYDDPYEGSRMRITYLNNLNLVARIAKQYGLEMRTFLQCVGNWTGMRDMTSIGDFRFQIYSKMAFGSKEFIYYEYGNQYSEAEGGYGLFDFKTETYNFIYDLAKTVNNEVHCMEDAYLAYDWDGIMCKNASDISTNVQFNYIKQDVLQSHPRVSFVDAEQDAIMGTFKNKKDGDDAFMLVNFNDPYMKLNNKVTLHFNNARGLLMYRLGQRMIVDLPASGNYTINLYPGEGRFIIPIK